MKHVDQVNMRVSVSVSFGSALGKQPRRGGFVRFEQGSELNSLQVNCT